MDIVPPVPDHRRRDPPAPIPRETPLPFWPFFRAFRENSITAWSRAAFTEPFVHVRGRGFVPDLVFVTDPALVRRVLFDAPDVYDKGDVVRRRLSAALGDSLLIAPEERWRPQRRITAPIFQARRVETFIPAMIDEARRSAVDLTARAGTVVDVHAAMIDLAYRVISRTAFSSDGVDDPAAFSRAIAEYFHALGRVDIASALGLPAWVPTIDRLRARPALALFRRQIGAVIARRRRRLAEEGAQALPDDLLTRLLTARDPQTGRPLSDESVYDNTVTFYAAGHETTANTLAWVLFLLSEHPEWDAAVHDEIATLPRDRDPGPEDLARLTLTRMVVDETLRLYPPAPHLPRQPIRDDDLGPIRVRAGTIVFTSPYVSQRHEARWSRPNAFDPTRFAPGRREAIDRFAYFPFGVGPRTCIGAQFSIQEVLIALVVLLRALRFEAAAPDAVFPQADITLSPRGGLPMRLVRRDDA